MEKYSAKVTKGSWIKISPEDISGVQDRAAQSIVF